MQIIFQALGATLLMATLGGCAGPGTGAESSAQGAALLQRLPEGAHWRLQHSSISGLEGGAGSEVSMVFADGKLTGDSSCNRFFADASIVDGRLQLGPIGASKRACPGPRMVAESALFAAFAQLDQAYLADSQLRLTTRGGDELVFVDDPSVAE